MKDPMQYVRFLLPGNAALLGASGVVFAFILMASVTGTKSKGVPLTMIIVAVIYIGDAIYSGITSTDNISQLTHIIGGCLGAVYAMALRKN